MPKVISPELADFKAQLDSWRGSHPIRSRIPPHFWQQAVSLLARHSVSAICRATHLHPEGLKKQAALLGVRPTSTSSPPTFLQFNSEALNCLPPNRTKNSTDDSTTRPKAVDYRLQLERPDGSRLSIQLPAPEWTRIEALYSLFLRL